MKATALRCINRHESGGWLLVDEQGKPLPEVSRFLEALNIRGLSPRTIRAYAYDILKLYRWLEERSISMLTHVDLFEFIKSQRGTEDKPRSINRRLSTTRLLFRFLTGKDIPQSNLVNLPAPSIKSIGRDHQIGLFRLKKPSQRQLTVKTERRLVEPLTKEQIQLFLESLRRYRDLSIVYLMLFCGLRSREVFELKVEQANLLEGQLRVLGKGKKERVIPLPDVLIASLRKYLLLERPKQSTSTHLFVILQGASRGQPMTAEGLRSLFRHRRASPLLSSAHPHRWRHTFGTEMAREGVHIHTLQKLMGHGDLGTTMQYINISMADIAEEYHRASKAIEARLRNKK